MDLSLSPPPPDAPVHRPRYTGALFPTLDNVYDGCWLDLARGEALVVTGRLPEARYTSFVFYDRWFATPDYRRVGCLVTGQEMVVSDERTYELYVEPLDPGQPTWVDTAGLPQGILAIRILLPELRELPGLRVVPAAGEHPHG